MATAEPRVRRSADGTPVYVEDARQELADAIEGLQLTNLEAGIIQWLYDCDQPAMHAIASLIRKAKDA